MDKQNSQEKELFPETMLAMQGTFGYDEGGD